VTDVTYVLIPGAGGSAWYWHLVDAELRQRGHDVVVVDLPADDDAAGLPEYTDTVIRAIGDRSDLVLVAQSMGAFTAPLVCERPSRQTVGASSGTVERTLRSIVRRISTALSSGTRTRRVRSASSASRTRARITDPGLLERRRQALVKAREVRATKLANS
jgi:pimeloyl-ACP methyl ester carboxylesterase